MSLDKLLNKVATQGKDQSVASSGGGDYTPAEAGQTGARIVAYYEVGQFESEYEGKKKTNDEVIIIFELIGKKHPAKELDGGVKVPVRISLRLNLSTNEKAGYFKMFQRLRTDEKHFVQLLGQPVLLNVVHKERGEGDKKRVYANIDKDTVRKPIVTVAEIEDGEPTGNLLEQVFNIFRRPITKNYTDAKAGRNGHGSTIRQNNRVVFQGGAYTLRGAAALVQICPGEKKDEFLPPIAPHDIGLPQAGCTVVHNVFQGVIPLNVPVAVIEQLKVIYIEQAHAAGVAPRKGVLQLCLGKRKKGTTVENPG